MITKNTVKHTKNEEPRDQRKDTERCKQMNYQFVQPTQGLATTISWEKVILENTIQEKCMRELNGLLYDSFIYMDSHTTEKTKKI